MKTLIKESNLTRVAIYARFSTEMQNKLSAKDQIDICKEKAESECWTVVATYSDDMITGEIKGRPGYQQLRQDIDKGNFDVVLTEGLSRLSRDEEECHNLYKMCKFLDTEIFSLSEGEIDHMKISMIASMGAMQRRATAAQVHRGIRAKAKVGKNVTRPAYGYMIPIAEDGSKKTGELEINEEQAAVIRRIMEDYASGLSPKIIASRLNEEGIPSPMGKAWKSNTINGNRKRGIGILNNDLYVGKQIWNRQKFVLNPKTEKRVARLNTETNWIVKDVPHLAIVSNKLWAKVKERQAKLDKRLTSRERGDKNRCSGAHATKRPVHLLSGLIRCGCCGGTMNIGGGNPGRYYCANAREKGHTICEGFKGIKRDVLEERVLSGIKHHLMLPEAVEVFLKKYTKEFNRLNAHKRQTKISLSKRLNGIEGDIANLMNAIKIGIITPSTKEELERLEAAKTELEIKLAQAMEDLPDIHPAISELYHQKVQNLIESLNAEETRALATEAVRGLLDKVIVNYDENLQDHTIKIQGELAALLGLADNKNAASYMETASSLKLVAGVGFEPTTFRL